MGPRSIRPRLVRRFGSPGGALQVVGVAHTGYGVFLYRAALGDIARRGVMNAVPDFGDRATAFWFMTSGSMLLLCGRLLRSAEEADDLSAQRTAGRALATIGLLGSAAMPTSGFWAVLAIGTAAWRRGSRHQMWGLANPRGGPRTCGTH